MACLSAIAWLSFMAPASAQTPSPLQEWQLAGGVVLEKMFEPEVPEWRSILGAAVAWHPIYDGAAPYRVQPGPVINIRYRDIAFASMGEGLGVNVLRGDNYRVGFAIGYDLGRHVSDYPSHLRGLGDIGAAPAFKLFGAYAVSKDFPLVLRFDIRAIVGGADGITGDLSAYMRLPGSSKKFIMFAGPSLKFAGPGYMQNAFGVDATQASLSGYRPFSARGGVKSLGFGFSATWFVTEHWLLNTDTAVERLLGAAAQSPITQEKMQGIVAVSVAYMW
jgi:outer membrane scaffolding protein for murein synthesis (MipA/OmpV family)